MVTHIGIKLCTYYLIPTALNSFPWQPPKKPHTPFFFFKITSPLLKCSNYSIYCDNTHCVCVICHFHVNYQQKRSTGTFPYFIYRMGAYISWVFNFAKLESFAKFIQRNLSHCAVTPMDNTNSRNLFNEFLQSSYSRKFRPAKYKRHMVVCSH